MENMAYDVIVVGGGNAALCAALAAREKGAKVALLERAPEDQRGHLGGRLLNRRVARAGQHAHARLWQNFAPEPKRPPNRAEGLLAVRDFDGSAEASEAFDAAHFREQLTVTPGRVVVAGTTAKRAARQVPDFLLYFTRDLPLGTVKSLLRRARLKLRSAHGSVHPGDNR